jgi:hypothetical protein
MAGPFNSSPQYFGICDRIYDLYKTFGLYETFGISILPLSNFVRLETIAIFTT